MLKLASKPVSTDVEVNEADNFLLQTLRDQAQTKIKLSWLVWHADSDEAVVDDLELLIARLEDSITNRRGKLLKPGIELLAHAHEMMGKIAFDKLDYAKAGGHFQERNPSG